VRRGTASGSPLLLPFLPALVLGFGTLGCGDGGDDAGRPGDLVDAGPRPSGDDDDADRSDVDAGPAPEPALTLGRGGERFLPLEAGDLVPLDRGSQAGGRREGGFHLTLALRLVGVPRDDVALLRVAVRDEEGVLQASTELLPRALVGADGVELVRLGINPILGDCCGVADAAATLSAELEPAEGAALSALRDQVEVSVGACLGDADVDLCAGGG
jgi:hypothetical protein